MSWKVYVLGWSVSALSIALILASVPFSELVSGFQRVSEWCLLGSTGLALLHLLVLEPDKFRHILSWSDRPIRFSESADLSYPMNALGIVTPPQAPEFLRARLIVIRYGTTMSRALGAVAVDKGSLLIAHVLVLIAAASRIYVFAGWWPAVLLAALVCVGSALLFFKRLPEHDHRPEGRLAGSLFEFTYTARRLGPARGLFILAYSLVVPCLGVLMLLLLISGTGIDIPIEQSVFWVTVALLASKLPVSIGGLGVREGILVLGLSSYAPVSALVSIGLLFGLAKWIVPTLVAAAFTRRLRQALRDLSADAADNAGRLVQAIRRIRSESDRMAQGGEE